MNYELAYTLGFHPWEKAGEDPAFTGQISELLDREEKGNRAPYGRALDVGTGSGRWAVELASRGWQVTGVDIVEKPLRRARLRVEEAGVDVRLVHGDVTGLRAAGVEPGFRLVLDTGTFHGLDDGLGCGRRGRAPGPAACTPAPGDEAGCALVQPAEGGRSSSRTPRTLRASSSVVKGLSRKCAASRPSFSRATRSSV